MTSLLQKAASSPAGPPAACILPEVLTVLAVIRATASYMIWLTPRRTQGLHEQRDPGKEDSDKGA